MSEAEPKPPTPVFPQVLRVAWRTYAAAALEGAWAYPGALPDGCAPADLAESEADAMLEAERARFPDDGFRPRGVNPLVDALRDESPKEKDGLAAHEKERGASWRTKRTPEELDALLQEIFARPDVAAIMTALAKSEAEDRATHEAHEGYEAVDAAAGVPRPADPGPARAPTPYEHPVSGSAGVTAEWLEADMAAAKDIDQTPEDDDENEAKAVKLAEYFGRVRAEGFQAAIERAAKECRRVATERRAMGDLRAEGATICVNRILALVEREGAK